MIRSQCLLVATLLSLAPMSSLSAQEQASFDSIEACQELEKGFTNVDLESQKLDAILSDPSSTREDFLAGIFQGTQLMLAYGETMFQLSERHENACKAALREAGMPSEILRIYRLGLDPTTRGYAFLGRVKSLATSLGDEQTAADMEVAMEGYKSSASQLVDFCLQDSENSKGCEELRREIELRLP